MKAAGKDIIWRFGLDYGKSERSWRIEEEGGYHFTPVVVHAGVENWIAPRLIVEGFVDYTPSNFGDRGAERYLVGPQVSVKALIFDFERAGEISLIPTARIGVGGGDYETQGGLHPHGGDDLVADGGASLAYTYMSLRGLGFEVGAGALIGGSFWQDYSGHTFLASFRFLIGPAKEYDCLEKLDAASTELLYKLKPQRAVREQLLVSQSENEQLARFLQQLQAEQEKYHQQIQSYCPKEPTAVDASYKEHIIPLMPEDAWAGLVCEEKLKNIEEASGATDVVAKEYSNLHEHMQEERIKLNKKLNELIAWSPLECSPISNPPRFLLFPNDNPDVDLRKQWRAELVHVTSETIRNRAERQKENDTRDAEKLIYANPILDEVILYLAKPENLGKKKLRLIAIANDTSRKDGKSDPVRDKKIARERLASVVEYLTLHGLQCEEKNGQLECSYKPLVCEKDLAAQRSAVTDRADTRQICRYDTRSENFGVKNHRNTREEGLNIGGAFSSAREGNGETDDLLKRKILSLGDVCSVPAKEDLELTEGDKNNFIQYGEAYTAKELFDDKGELKAAVKPFFPSSLGHVDIKSPVFRSVLIEIVDADSCPAPLLSEVDEDVPPVQLGAQ